MKKWWIQSRRSGTKIWTDEAWSENLLQILIHKIAFDQDYPYLKTRIIMRDQNYETN
jgi:hypothetical protein